MATILNKNIYHHGDQTKQKQFITMTTKLNKNIYHHGDQTKQKQLLPWRPN